ncbi:MAG: DUF4105 domain-containing protein [Candidatus Eisenbacteria bacterium]
MANACNHSATSNLLTALLRFLLCAACALVAAAGHAEEATPPASPDTTGNAAYIAALIARADSLGLDRDRYWDILLHYKRGFLGLGSVVDDPKFFASPLGKGDPRAELHATLRSFFEPAVSDTTVKHPVCRFAARFEWLKEKLAIDESRLLVPRCQPLEDLISRIQPESVTLVFPTAHMNSPASMYGHTFLTIETATKSKLLAYAVNYSALTSGTTFAPVYLAKGLLGGYPGYFSILPYYAKLQEYSDVSDRDIWEYPLTLDHEEVLRLVRHTYELEGVYSNYFFFGENCSYGLLYLLEAARPSVHLTDQFGWWVIPLDTIRAARRSGLVADAVYRPSKSTKVEYLGSLLDRHERDAAYGVVRRGDDPGILLSSPLPNETKIRTLDLASEYLQYVYAKGKMAKPVYVPRFLKLLEARSSLGMSDEWRYDIPAPPRPDEGHRSNRLSLAGGAVEGESFQEVRLRPAYHALLDNERGFKRGSAIVFGDVAVRYHPVERRARLEAIDLIDIVSLAPRTRFFKHTSWRVSTGFARRSVRGGGEPLVWNLNPGMGRAWDRLALVYAMVEGDVALSGALRSNGTLGGGASLGALRDLGPWRGSLEARFLRYGVGDPSTRVDLSFGQRLRLSTNQQITLALERREVHDVVRTGFRGALDLFF